MRRSLLTRLSALTLVVIVLSVAAAAWLATVILNQGIHQADRRSGTQVATVYRSLLRYGATHRSWSHVGPLVRQLGSRAGLQIELYALSDHRLAVAQVGSRPLPVGSPVAVVDPLHVDAALYPHAPSSRIDPSAVGPFRLGTADRAMLERLALNVLACASDHGTQAHVVVAASGRPVIVSHDPRLIARCGGDKLIQVTPFVQKLAFSSLTELTNVCLQSAHLPKISLLVSLTRAPLGGGPRRQAAAQRCLDLARREQLDSWVAPPAVLYITVPPTQRSAIVFSARNELRIAEIAAAVIALAMGATLLAGARLVRPLRALTVAARGVEEHGFTEVVEVSGDDEISHLTRAFNQMVRTQAQMQEERRAAIGDIAHELRTPLANIRAWLEAARDGIADKDEELVGSLLEEATLLQRTVDDLQLLSQVDAGRLELELREVPLLPLLRQVQAALSGPADVAHVSIELDCPDVMVVVDPDRLRQVMQNLVSNAVRHSFPGGSITVTAAAETDAQLRIDVIDHGAGIDPEDLPRVFDRFWRAEKSRSRAAGGSGLGLAIVRQLVEAHGGTVGARSVPGEETVLSVWLPTPVGPCDATRDWPGPSRPDSVPRGARS